MQSMENIPVRKHLFHELGAWNARSKRSQLPLLIDIDEPHRHVPLGVWHHHTDFFALYVVNRGRGVHTIDDVSYGISRGDVYLMYPGMRHRYSQFEDLLLDNVFFPPSILDSAMQEALALEGGLRFSFGDAGGDQARESQKEGRILHLTPSGYADLAGSLAELKEEWSRGTLSGDILTLGLLFRLLVHLARTSNKYRESKESRAPSAAAERPEGRETTIAAAVRYLDEHFAEPLRIPELADSLCLSPDRFSKLFLSVMGQTPRHYLGVVRMERAKVLLSTTDIPISQICWQSGFEEPAYFTRIFRAATGLPPSQYRRQFSKKG